MLESTEEDGIYTTTCELVEIGPLNGPDKNNKESIKAMIRDNAFNSDKNQQPTCTTGK